MKFLNAFILVGSFATFISCGSDEEGHAPTVRSESAEWSMLVDGELVEGDKMEITDTEERGVILRIYNSITNEFVTFPFGSENPKVKTYLTDNQFVAHYNDTLDSVEGGSFTISKYSKDSLKANFEFPVTRTSVVTHYVITEGVIKARLR